MAKKDVAKIGFVSESVRARLQNLARTVSRNFKILLKWSPEGSRTDGTTILVCGVDPWFEGCSREEWMVGVKWIAIHEAAHVLLSNFRAWTDWQKRWDADAPGTVVRHVGNSLEDGRIERAISNLWPGALGIIRFGNLLAFRKFGVADHLLTDVLNGFLARCRVGQDIPGMSSEALEWLDRVQPLIDEGRHAEDTAGCLAAADKVLKILQPLFPKKDEAVEGLEEAGPMPEEIPEAAKAGKAPEGSEAGLDPHRKYRKPKPTPAGGERKPSTTPENGSEGSSASDSEGAEAGTAESDASAESGDAPNEEPGEAPGSGRKGAEPEGGRGDDGDTPNEEEESDGSSEGGEGEHGDEADSSDGEDDAGAISSDGLAEDDELSDETGSSEGPDGAGDNPADGSEPTDESGDGAGSGEHPDEADEPDADDGAETAANGADGSDSDSEEGTPGAADGDAPGGDSLSPGPGGAPGDEEDDTWEEDFSDVLATALEDLSKAVQEERELSELVQSSSAASPEAIAKDLAKGLHDRVRFEMREVQVNEGIRDNFKSLSVATDTYQRQLVKELQPLFEKQRDAARNHLKRGRLDTRNVWRLPAFKETKVFMRPGREGHRKKIAFSVLMDTSGSQAMSVAPGVAKYEVMQAAAVLMGNAAKTLNIPATFVSFNTNERGQVRHRRHAAFDSTSMEGLGYLSPDGGNRDGFSVRVAAAELAQRPEDVKVLFVLSDGLPADFGDYFGATGVQDTKAAVAEAMKAGLHVIGFFFGPEWDEPQARDMYPNLVVANDVTKLPALVARVFRAIVQRAVA